MPAVTRLMRPCLHRRQPVWAGPDQPQGRSTACPAQPPAVGPRRFDSLSALSPDAIICADGSNRITSWNKAAETIFGYPARDVLGQPLNIIVPPEFRARHDAGLGRVAAGEAPKLAGRIVAVTAMRHDGTEFPIELSLTHWTEEGHHHFGAIIRDITERRATEDRLRREAEIDHLTGIPNRKLLLEWMEEASRAGQGAALILFDLDGFKDVNDSLGHAAGDEVLKQVARRLEERAAGRGLVARLGGDEFAIFDTRRPDPESLRDLAHVLVAAIEKAIPVEERSVYVGAGAGFAVTDAPGWTPEDLLRDADLALYRAKADGRSHVRLFTPDLLSISQARMSVSSDLRQGWERREFELHYQPQVRLADGTLTGAEALIRWNHPTRGPLGLPSFLPVLESSLLAGPVFEWSLRAACEQAARWRRRGPADLRIAVNLFAAQFIPGNLPRMVGRALADFGLPAAALDLELTEATILRSDSRMLADLHVLRAQGVGIVLDHFGTGHASIAMLRDHPLTRIKIDRSLVGAVGRSPGGLTVLDGVARLGRGFGLAVTADGVETAEQARLLRPHCSDAQGTHFGQSVPAEEFEALHLAGRAAPVSQGPAMAPAAVGWDASPRRTMGNSQLPRPRPPLHDPSAAPP